MDFDQLEAARDVLLAVDRGVRRLDQRRLAHAARAPQKRVVGGQRAGEAPGVLDQKVAHPVDAAQERDVDAVDARDGRQRAAVGAPDEGFRGVEIGRGRGRRREPLERVGDAGEKVGLALERRQRVGSSVKLQRALPQIGAKLQRPAGKRNRFAPGFGSCLSCATATTRRTASMTACGRSIWI